MGIRSVTSYESCLSAGVSLGPGSVHTQDTSRFQCARVMPRLALGRLGVDRMMRYSAPIFVAPPLSCHAPLASMRREKRHFVRTAMLFRGHKLRCFAQRSFTFPLWRRRPLAPLPKIPNAPRGLTHFQTRSSLAAPRGSRCKERLYCSSCERRGAASMRRARPGSAANG